MPALRQALQAMKIESFKAKPTVELFRGLVAAVPSLEPTLIDVVKVRIETGPSPAEEDFTLGLEFAVREKDTDAIVSLVHKLRSHRAPRSTDLAVSAVKKLLHFGSSRAAVDIVRDRLQHVQQNIWSDFWNALPNLDMATADFEDAVAVARPRFPSKAKDDTPAQAQKRVKLVAAFVASARMNAMDYDNPLDSFDSNDSDYGEALATFAPDYSGQLETWAGVLDQLGDPVLRLETRMAVWSSSDESFYDFDGLAYAIADRFVCPGPLALQA